MIRNSRVRVEIFNKSLSVVSKSGVGRAMKMQIEYLKKLGVEIVEKGEKTNVVHFNTVFPSDYRYAKKAKEQGKKIVYHAHSTEEDFCNSFLGSNVISPLFKKWIVKCYSLGDVIVTPTEYSKEILRGYGIKKKIYPVSNGVDTNKFVHNNTSKKTFRKKYGIDNEKKIIMSVGLYFQRKGILDFIELAKKMPEYQFIWFGYTPSYQLPSHIRKAFKNLPLNITFPGYVSSEELIDAYSACDLFLFPSYEETEGIVVLEALSCEIPVLLRNIPVYKGWLKNKENVYKASTNEEFQTCITEILEGKVPLLIEQGLKVAKDRDIFNQVSRLKEIYEEVLNESAYQGEVVYE